MKIWFQIRECISWRIKAKNRHGIHSPFVYNFLDKCVYAKTNTAEFEAIEIYRRKLLKRDDSITFNDYGAGSGQDFLISQTTSLQKTRKIKEIAQTSLKSPDYCRLFFRIIRYFNCREILELGTSFGLTTAYMSYAAPDGKIETIEGAEPIAEMASAFFQAIGAQNINLYTGRFNVVLPTLPESKMYDLIFLDGDHREDSTWNYFLWALKHIKITGVLIVDDIRWSKPMNSAWKSIKKHPDVKVTLDLHNLGLVFFETRLSKEDFKIKF